MSNGYENGKIYRIQFADGHYYIGSTIVSLSQRLCAHGSTMKKGDTRKLYNKMRECNDYSIHLVIDYPCNSKRELCIKENEFITFDDMSLNTVRAHQTSEERKISKKLKRQENKEHHNAKQREYRRKMNPEIKERQRLQKKEYDVKYRMFHSSTSSIQTPSSK